MILVYPGIILQQYVTVDIAPIISYYIFDTGFLNHHINKTNLKKIEARYSYARDRAVGFSEFWQPLKWSEEEWERRSLVELGDRNSWHVQKFPRFSRIQDYWAIEIWKQLAFTFGNL